MSSESADARLERLQRRKQSEASAESANDRLERLQREAERKHPLRTVASVDKVEQLQRRRQRRCQLTSVRATMSTAEKTCNQKVR